MNHYPILQILFIFFLIFSFTSGRRFFSDNTNTYPDEYEDKGKHLLGFVLMM
jgi:hypothetical protein